jgi:hypothetical protein
MGFFGFFDKFRGGFLGKVYVGDWLGGTPNL